MSDKNTILFWQILFIIVSVSLMFVVFEQKEVIVSQDNIISLQEKQIDLLKEMHVKELEFQNIVFDVRLESAVNECYLATGYEVRE